MVDGENAILNVGTALAITLKHANSKKTKH